MYPIQLVRCLKFAHTDIADFFFGLLTPTMFFSLSLLFCFLLFYADNSHLLLCTQHKKSKQEIFIGASQFSIDLTIGSWEL